ncbi:hypothetical protein CROQUDRAFT_673439 [Cronartium quercuum f. sp. fusiforme G11]|uniref:Mediator of RNA polymerase II transcription subunit 7 n=1 Tax=Cronartium quercuum f. sp. fusiforme G11 TaxID=708437 RepID=A0A9P6NEC6_9BASI|nr:hypothetical protein CROQUDRAFT_673439 [Cronartium quercuum f. sp. fusiforme G11]
MESNEINSSFFPSPPSRYRHFTNRNLSLAQQLWSNSNTHEYQPFDAVAQRQALIELSCDQSNQSTGSLDEQKLNELQEIDLRTLVQPPNLDWIRDRGGWTAFGDWEPWPGMASRATLEGMPKLYDEGMERKDALRALLNTLIHSYIQLLNVLGMQGPPSLTASTQPNQPILPSTTDQIVSHIELAAFNMHGLCNELRPRQARETLKLMMKEQAREKREKARLVLKTCDELKTQLLALRSSDASVSLSSQLVSMKNQSSASCRAKPGDSSGNPSDEQDQDWETLLSAAENF